MELSHWVFPFVAAPATSQAAATYLIGQQEEQAQLEQEAVEGQVCQRNTKKPELAITGVQADVTKDMLMIDSLGIGALIILSTSAASILIFRKNPKKYIK